MGLNMRALNIFTAVVVSGVLGFDYAVAGTGNDSKLQASIKKEFIVLLPSIPEINSSGIATKTIAGFDSDAPLSDGYRPIPKLDDAVLAKIALNCTQAKKSNNKFLAGLVVPIVGFAIEFVVDRFIEGVDERLQKKLDKYESSYSANVTIPIRRTKCVRLVRGTASENKFEIGLDVIMKLDPRPSQNIIQASVLTASGLQSNVELGNKFTYSISAQFKGFVEDKDGISQQIEYPSKVIHTGNFGDGEFTAKCPLNNDKNNREIDSCALTFPYPGKPSENLGVTELTLQVSEVGTDGSKKRLENWKELLSGIKDDAGSTLGSAVESLIE